MKYWRITGIVAILLLVVLGFLYQAAPYMILTPRKFNLAQTPADWGLPFEKITIPTADSLQLNGYWIHQPGDTGKTTIVLLHGVGGCKEHWLPTATWLWQQGYETVLMDARAHGESEGAYCTYGYFEKKDVATVAAWLNNQHPGVSLGVWGNSMGGAIALQALATVPQLRFGIVESTFADFRTIVFDYQRHRLKIPWRWFADSGIARAAEMAHFEPDSIQPAESARHIRQPVLLAHGDADTRIRVDYGRQIFANLASSQKELHIIPGAGHYDVMARGGDTYRATLLRFLAAHTK
ncbi:MAG: alpha/beta fold hydrolase [Saprospiraceae bacterium]|nr:alpha/beta fold hydrolase [Saprospiraceae bacterium]